MAQVAFENSRHPDTSKVQSHPGRHRDHALFDRHLGIALHGDGRRGGRQRLSPRSKPAPGKCGASLLQVKTEDVEFADGRVGSRGHRRCSACRISRAPGICVRRTCRPTCIAAAWRPPRGYKPGTRQRHLQLRRACRDRGGRSPELGDGRDSGLRHRRGRRQAGQSNGGRRSNLWRSRARYRHRAVFGDLPFDNNGQPLATTFADYLLPGPTEVPEPHPDHIETLAPYTEFGVKGIGEGGAIAPPAAIANAVNDALKGLGAELLCSPITPRRVLESIAAAKLRRASAAVPAGARS